jgi:signal transduction histidine kinase/ABC-type multidrug transport system ATPase subunit
VGRSSASERGESEATPPLLEAVRITKRFGPVTVLRDVTLRVRRGEVVALVGETGAGKSSLVACLARILDPEDGEIRLDGAPMPATPDAVRRAGVEILWQDHGLCDDLDVVANVALGRERPRLFAKGGMRQETAAVLHRVGADGLPLDRAVRTLSRGQRQLVALGRALLPEPRLLLLDEPTASLGVLETLRVQGLIRQLRDRGTGVLLVTHDLEQVFGLADRIVVLRQGRLVADVSPMEVQRADVVALMSGIEMDSAARRQLQRLRSLVDQLSDVEPAASFSLIVSAMAAALDQEMLCVHLLEGSGDNEPLRRSAAVGLPAPMLRVNDRLPIGSGGGCAGLAVETADVVVVDDLSTHPVPARYREAAAASGIRSEWAAPIVGTRGVLGTVSGFGTSVGRPEPERLELARVYLGHAASAIERERLLAEVSRRNRVLESLRGMLETLAGPDRVEGSLGASLLALSRGLGAAAVGALVEQDDQPVFRATKDPDGRVPEGAADRLRSAAAEVLTDRGNGHARVLAPDLAAVTLRLPQGRAALVALWSSGAAPTADTLELLDDASRSLALAMEGEALERTRREAAALRRSQAIQRELLSWLSHELRTPLTAIQGYASTLCQPDLTWDAESTERFLLSIAAESARMERLVGDLLDSTAIESGTLRLQGHWCDLRLVVEAAVRCVPARAPIHVRVADAIEPVWGDHDRLEQVMVNLLENAVTHGWSDAGVEVTLRLGAFPGTVEMEVRDHGPGIPATLSRRMFEPRVRGATDVAGAGLGLSIARGIVEAHGGMLATRDVERGASFVVTLPAEPPADAADGMADATWNLVDDPKEPHVL